MVANDKGSFRRIPLTRPDTPVMPRVVFRIVAQVWLILLIVGSLQPARPSLVTGFHREIHWLAFAGATFLLLLLSRNRRQEIWSAVGVFLLGLSLECLQHLLYRSPMEWWDARDDALSIIAAFALYQFLGAPKPASAPPH